jgi:hypothetical protein
LAEGDSYPGDLLHAVVRLPAQSWTGLEAERSRLVGRLVPLLTAGDFDLDMHTAARGFVEADIPG